jgi:hypothetical protein
MFFTDLTANAKHEESLRAAAAQGASGAGLHQHHTHIGAPWIRTRGGGGGTSPLFSSTLGPPIDS